MGTLGDWLNDAQLAQSVNLRRFSEGEEQAVAGLLNGLGGELAGKIQGSGINVPGTNTERHRALRELLSETKGIIGDHYDDTLDWFSGDLAGVAGAEADVLRGVMDATGVQLIRTQLPQPEMLRRLVDKTMIQGAPSAEWWGRQSQTLQRNFADQLRMGMASGEGIDDMVRRIRGTATGRRNTFFDPRTGARRQYVEFAGGVMDTSTRNARALVRTSVMSAAAEARRDQYRANDDVVKGLEQVSTLDGKTTKICILYDGERYEFSEEWGGYKPIGPKFLPWRGGVPRHWGCRSTEIPTTITWRELGIDMDELPPMTRHSMDGEVPGDMTASQWLRQKDLDNPAFGNRVFGKRQAELWRDGRINERQLIDQKGRGITLKELRARGLDPDWPDARAVTNTNMWHYEGKGGGGPELSKTQKAKLAREKRKKARERKRALAEKKRIAREKKKAAALKKKAALERKRKIREKKKATLAAKKAAAAKQLAALEERRPIPVVTASNVREFRNEQEFSEWREQFRDEWDALTLEQQKAIGTYKGFGYSDINQSMRGFDKTPDGRPFLPGNIEAIPRINESMTPIPEDIHVYRGTSLSFLDRIGVDERKMAELSYEMSFTELATGAAAREEALELLKDTIGGEFSDPAFTSTRGIFFSDNPENALSIFTTKEVQFGINVPKGTPAIFPDFRGTRPEDLAAGGVGLLSDQDELEMIFGGGARYRILDAYPRENQLGEWSWYFELEMIP